ncbi:hypothetical protein BDW02DRAFT_493 [Decorospora gaudefroyi]|uniref:Uncharacterized protein n=1 Tax=Decorospora gaudefroyi TaxID=184978 RepID=A0A6A5KX30_9PLEO|nr:hypothetical protein BDW02DRAFT_493 [Decorospora gaudefroyi]
MGSECGPANIELAACPKNQDTKPVRKLRVEIRAVITPDCHGDTEIVHTWGTVDTGFICFCIMVERFSFIHVVSSSLVTAAYAVFYRRHHSVPEWSTMITSTVSH